MVVGYALRPPLAEILPPFDSNNLEQKQNGNFIGTWVPDNTHVWDLENPPVVVVARDGFTEVGSLKDTIGTLASYYSFRHKK